MVASNASEKSAGIANRIATETPAKSPARRRGKGRPFKPGNCASPHGRGAREAKRQELFDAILKDTGGPLTALETAFAHEAARQLARAATSKDDALRVRLVNASGKAIDRIKASIAARNTGPKRTAFDEYVSKLNAGKR